MPFHKITSFVRLLLLVPNTQVEPIRCDIKFNCLLFVIIMNFLGKVNVDGNLTNMDSDEGNTKLYLVVSYDESTLIS